LKQLHSIVYNRKKKLSKHIRRIKLSVCLKIID